MIAVHRQNIKACLHLQFIATIVLVRLSPSEACEQVDELRNVQSIHVPSFEHS
jgi:hypothetical protein